MPEWFWFRLFGFPSAPYGCGGFVIGVVVLIIWQLVAAVAGLFGAG